jgi:hypothetical protein
MQTFLSLSLSVKVMKRLAPVPYVIYIYIILGAVCNMRRTHAIIDSLDPNVC